MPKIAIVVDSTANLTQEQKSRFFAETVPVNVMFEGRVYKDGIDLTAAQAYEFLEKNPDDWATSAPSPGDFMATFKKMVDQGTEEIICLTPPPALSATWDSARMAKKSAESEMPQVKIEVIDTGTIVIGETLMVLRIGEAIEAGKNFQEAVQLAEELKEKVRVFIILDTIRYIYRSGRVPEIASKIGSILPLKPILSAHGGRLKFAGAAISREKSKQKVLDILKESFNLELPEVGLMYIDTKEETRKLGEKISQMIPESKTLATEFSPVLGYALGRGAIGVGFFAK